MKKKDEHIGIRTDARTKRSMKREAKRMKMYLSGYFTWLHEEHKKRIAAEKEAGSGV